MSGNLQTNENVPGGRQQDDAAAGGQQSQADLEKLARSNGWRPKAEFKGFGEWVDAAEYLRRNEEHLPIIKGRLKKTEEQLAAARADTAALRAEVAAGNTQLASANQAVNDIREMLTTAEERSYKRAVADLSKKMDTAIADGDQDAARAARAELESVTEEARKRAEKVATTKKTADDATQPRTDPAATAWIASDEQAWYREIPGAKGWAEQMFVDPKYKHLGVADRLAKISAEAPDVFGHKYPTYFKAAEDDDEPEKEEPEDKGAEEERVPARRAARVAQPRGTQGGARSREPTFEDLPPEAKAAYAREAKAVEDHGKAKGTGAKFTKEEYLATYKAIGGFDDWKR